MAAPMGKFAGDPNTPNMTNASNVRFSDSSEDTDIVSPFFNPLTALYADEVILPFQDVPLFNNLIEFENALKKNPNEVAKRPARKPTRSSKTKGSVVGVVKKLETEPSKVSASNTNEEIVKAEELHRLRRLRRNRSVLTRMDRYEKGPYSFLRRCVREHQQVAVWTRGAVDIRGVCKGLIVAFDKHFNLALLDVDEVYRPPVTRSRRGQTSTRGSSKSTNDNVTKTEIGKTCRETVSNIDKTDLSERLSPDLKQESGESIEQGVEMKVQEKTDSLQEMEDKVITMTKNLGLGVSESAMSNERISGSQVKKITTKNLELGVSETAVSKNSDSESILGSQAKKASGDSDPNQVKVLEKGNECGENSEGLTEIKRLGEKFEELPDDDRLVIGFNQFMGKDVTKIKLCKRHVNQMFIRGDNVVSVAILP